MPKIDVPSLKGQELMSFDALPAGSYRIAVDRVEERDSNAGGKGLMWLFRVTDVLHTNLEHENPESLVGRTLVHGTSFSEASLWNLFRTLIALGDEPEDVENINDLDTDDYPGKECVVQVTLREYPIDSGTMTNNIQNMRALTEEEAGVLA